MLDSVIVRILTAHVPSPNAGQFHELLRAQLAELQTQPGLLYAKLARRLDDNHGEEVILIEEWRTPADVLLWTRGVLTKPRLLPGTEDLVEDLIITHYEALDLSPDDLQLRVFGAAGLDGDGGGTAAEEGADEEPTEVVR